MQVRKKLRLGLAGIFICALILVGCTESLRPKLTSPRLSDEEESVKKALKSILNTSSQLHSPRSGGIKNAINFVDLDNDGETEVVVFYYQYNSEQPYHCMVMKRISEQWVVINNIERNAKDIKNVYIADVTGDKKKEIIIGWQDFQDDHYGLDKADNYVYAFKGDGIKEYHIDKSNYLTIGNIDGASSNGIVTLNLNRKNLIGKVNLYRYSNGKFNLLDSTEEIDGRTSAFDNITIGKIYGNQMGIVLDGYMGAIGGITEVLTIHDYKLSNYWGESALKYKKTYIPSKDIDQDGILEVGMNFYPEDTKNLTFSRNIVSWYKLAENKKLNFVMRQYEGYYNQYKFKFPENWDDKVVGLVDGQEDYEKNISFAYYDRIRGSVSVIATFKTENVKKSDDMKLKEEGYQYLASFLNDKIYVKINENIGKNQALKRYYVTFDEVKEHFNISN
jgi:hypothetical protein